MSSIKGEAKLQITEFDEYLLHETERVSPNKSGRKCKRLRDATIVVQTRVFSFVIKKR